MPFSIQFSVTFTKNVLQPGTHSYVVGLNANRSITMLYPTHGSFHIIETALALGFIESSDEEFWSNQLPEMGLQYPVLFAHRVVELCQESISFELVHPHTLQKDAEILLIFRKYINGQGKFLFFPAIVTEMLSIEGTS